MDKLRDAIRAYYRGAINQTELYQIFWDTKHGIGIPPDMIWTQFDQMLRTQGGSEGVDMGMEGNLDVPPPPPTKQAPSTLPEADYEAGAYLRGLKSAGLNAGLGGGAFGKYLAGRYAPTQAVYLGQKALQPGTEIEPDNAFEEYSRQTRGGNLGREAQRTFQDLVAKATTGKWEPGDPFSEYTTNYLPQANLALEASRGRLGGYAANYLLPDAEKLIQQWRSGPTATDDATLLASLKRALGL